MKHYSKVTPEGTRDLLFEECVQRATLIGNLTELFQSRGYREVRTPTIEFYDVFGTSSGYLPQESMFKMTDHRGRLMVLRPDCTIPIARMVSTRLSGIEKPLRLFYSQNVYRMEHELRGKPCEIHQTGVELIGCGSLRGDLEMVELAASGLSSVVKEDYRIELCHIGYFKALMDCLCANDAEKESIRQSIEQKNFTALNDLLEPFGDDRAAMALKYLPRLFGGEEVFERAAALFSENGAAKSLSHLHKIYKNLCQLGQSKHLMIDLGLVNQAEYYTGIIFRGYFDGIGEPVLSGGRYDCLLEDFGEPLPATGFAFSTDPAARMIAQEKPVPPNILVYADDAHLPQAINYSKSLVQDGFVVENAVFDEFDDALAYAKKQGIPLLHMVADEIKVINLQNL